MLDRLTIGWPENGCFQVVEAGRHYLWGRQGFWPAPACSRCLVAEHCYKPELVLVYIRSICCHISAM